jgi:hypothetical protein
MNKGYTVTELFDEFVAERHALGYVGTTSNGAIRRFLSDFVMPDEGND